MFTITGVTKSVQMTETQKYDVKSREIEMLNFEAESKENAMRLCEAFISGRTVIKEDMGDDRAIVRFIPQTVQARVNGGHWGYSHTWRFSGVFTLHTLWKGEDGLWNVRPSTHEEINSF